MQSISIVNRIARNTGGVGDIRAERQVLVERFVGSGPGERDDRCMFPLNLCSDTADIDGFRAALVLREDIDTLEVDLGFLNARVGREVVLRRGEGHPEKVLTNSFKTKVKRSFAAGATPQVHGGILLGGRRDLLVPTGTNFFLGHFALD
jgi:hypothetical protein